MRNLAEILHNMHEHTETYHRLLQEGELDGEFVQRLCEHIVLEESENSQLLQGLERTPLAQKMLDHSYFLQQMIRQPEMPLDLKLELLHHFLEEHQEWERDLSPQTHWTVGPLWPRKG
ncbi:hypothetical protein DYH09_00610 [bacterium CPR1]|nr:hypothetical protein [bacterium CPR1]